MASSFTFQKLRTLVSMLAFLFAFQQVHADWGMFQTYIFLDAEGNTIGFAGNTNADGAPYLPGASFHFVEGQNELKLIGGELKTWKNGASNVCGGQLNYRLTAAGEVPGAFAVLDLGFQENLPNPGDQKWGAYNGSTNLIADLPPGDYTLEVYWNLSGGLYGGCDETIYESNDGNNYMVTISIEPAVPCVNTFTLNYMGVDYNLELDGNGRCWMAENLQNATFNDGTEIPYPENGIAWNFAVEPLAVPPGGSVGWVSEFGRLYNGMAASNGAICPSGWRVPSLVQWQALIDANGGELAAGGPLKETGTVQNGDGSWNEPNTGATNISGLSVRPSGFATPTSMNNGFRSYAYFWTSDYAMVNPDCVSCQEKYVIALRWDATTSLTESYDMNYGFSVRCLERIEGCLDNTACNYDPTADDHNPLLCESPTLEAFADLDGDGWGDPDSPAWFCTEIPEGFVTNALDGCPLDPAKADPGACGCGVEDVDSDGDEVPDCAEVVGCQDPAACNFHLAATDPGVCEYLPEAPSTWANAYISAEEPTLELAMPEGSTDWIWFNPSGQIQLTPTVTTTTTGTWEAQWRSASLGWQDLPLTSTSFDFDGNTMDGSVPVPTGAELIGDATYSPSTDGMGGQRLDFTASNAGFTAPATEVPASFTVALRIEFAEFPSSNNWGTVFGKSAFPSSGWVILARGGSSVTNRLRFWGLAGEWDIPNTNLNLNQEYHVAMVKSGTTWSFYLDGELVDTRSVPSDWSAAEGLPWMVGIGDNPSYIYPMNGYADDFSVWSQALSANQIAAHMGNHFEIAGNCFDSAFIEVVRGGCTDESACNYDIEATLQATNCLFPSGVCEICNGATDGTGAILVPDVDGDGVCDADEIEGCQDSAACNFNVDATDPGLCNYPETGLDCDGNCLNDADDDGVCDENEIEGCQDSTACNFNADATNPGICNYPAFALDCDGNCLSDVDEDGICDENEIEGCQDSTACNYNADATDAGNCEYATNVLDCDGNCFNDADEDGICDENEIEGCQDSTACNYNSDATDPSICNYASAGLNCDGNCLNDADSDGICDENEIEGCQDFTACNYNAEATDPGICNYAASGLDCDGNCLNDADEDGICDENEVQGCTDPTACNFDNSQGINHDPTLCLYVLDCNGDCGGSAYETPSGCCIGGNTGYTDINCMPNGQTCDFDAIVGNTSLYGTNGFTFQAGRSGPLSRIAIITGALGDHSIEIYDNATDELLITASPDAAAGDGAHAWTDYTLTGVNVSAGAWYRVMLVAGWGTFGVDPNAVYPGGTKFGSNAASAGYVAFKTIVCPEISGCLDPSACNYDASATLDSGDCSYAPAGLDCDGNCLNDADEDDICDENEVAGCQDSTACNYNASATDPGICNYPQTGLNCDGSCINDTDEDGICDENEVTGCSDSTACNYNASATDPGICDYPQTGLNCDGNCLNDADEDGVCDENEVTGCQDSTACNYNSSATDPGICNYPQTGLNCDGSCINDADEDGVCDEDEVVGCQDSTACNYNASATDPGICNYPQTGLNCDGSCINDADEDGVCDEDEVVGCQDSTACNYNANATDPAICDYAASGLDCDGNCLNDADSDGVCDENEIEGCQDSTACNYNANATDPAICDYAASGLDCDGNCIGELDCNGDCAGTATETASGCCIGGNTGYDAYNCSPNGQLCDYDDEIGSSSSFPVGGFTFQPSMSGALTRIRLITPGGPGIKAELRDRDTGELLGQGIAESQTYNGYYNWNSFTFTDLAVDEGHWYKVTLTGGYSTNIGASNSNAYPGGTVYGINSGTSGYATFKTIICSSITGCMAPTACNYDDLANLDDGSCHFATNILDCDGNCINDADEDGVCDEDEVTGCQDSTACNYNADATDPGICNYALAGLDCDGNCLNDTDEDGVCDENEIEGCQDSTACNYNADATDPGTCDYAASGLDCDGVCLNDADEDGVCDEDEVTGCQDSTACNYNADATDEGICNYALAGLDCDGNCLNDTDEDGVCDENEIEGCQDSTACNYNADATDPGICNYAATGLDCDGNCINDADSDGVCDENEVTGCQDPTACNYNADATDAGICNYASSGLDCDGNCLNDTDEDGVCDEDEVTGCQDANACNFDASATDAGTCAYPTVWYADADGDGVGATYVFELACEQPAGYVATNGDTCPGDANKLSPGLCGCGVVDTDIDGDGLCDAVDGCTDVEACNYDQVWATTCYSINSCGTCGPATTVTCGLQGACNYDPSGDCFDSDLCDFDSCAGCMNANACNFDAAATISAPLTCTFPAFAWEDCDGNCLNDANDNGVCDEVDVPGCTDAAAINYNPNATADNGSCFTVLVGCVIPSALNYDPAATVQGSPLLDYCTFPPSFGSFPGPGIAMMVAGCMDSNACNYNPAATTSDGSCEFLSCQGCTETSACNYDATALYNDGSCEWTSCVGCMNPAACDYDPMATIADTCDFVSCQGCTDSAATNFDPTASIDDGSCILEGCTNASACNYDAAATSNDGSCTYAAAFYDCNGDCNNDTDGDGVCDELEIAGCTSATACNYDAAATDDDGSCVEPSVWYEDADGDGAGDSNSSTTACVQPAGYVANATDGCPANTNKLAPGDCGCDTPDTDSDGDGIADCNDSCINLTACNYDANPTEACAFATIWYADTDGDGLGDVASTTSACEQPTGYVATAGDTCPSDANKQAPGDCGCGVADADSDGDGISDCDDDCTNTAACNYDANPTEACDFGTPGYDCDGVCLDLNNNSTCDLDEGSYAGCQDETACNYDPVASLPDPASCTYIHLTAVAVDAASAAGVADGLVVPAFTGGTSSFSLYEVDEDYNLPSSLWGAMTEGRYRFRVEDADGCLSVETRGVLVPHVKCD